MQTETRIVGLIARHDEDPFWGLIVIDNVTGIITSIQRGRVYQADYYFGPDCLIFAGFGNVHIHAREDETGEQCYKETYQTACDAALHGGVVHVSAMPNTPRPLVSLDEYMWHRARVRAIGHPVTVINYIGIRKGSRPIGKRGEHPYKCFFGKSVGPLSILTFEDLDETLQHYRGEYVSFHVEFEAIVVASAQGKTHSDRRPAACVFEGLKLLLPLIEKYGIHAKLCHWPMDEGTFALIEEYRSRGCDIELEASPLHLCFSTDDTDKDPSLWLMLQMNPALRGAVNPLRLIQGLRIGFVDYLADDHAPHTLEEKYLAFAKFRSQYPDKSNVEIAALVKAENPELFLQTCCENNTSGAPWLDTYALVCTWLMREHGFRPQDIARIAAYNPGRFVNRFLPAQYPGRDFGKGFGDIAEGYMGSLTVLNTAKATTVDRKDLKTKVGWSPFEGRAFPGAVEAVFIAGKRY